MQVLNHGAEQRKHESGVQSLDCRGGLGEGLARTLLSSTERFWDVVRIARGERKPLGRLQENPGPLCLPEACPPRTSLP